MSGGRGPASGAMLKPMRGRMLWLLLAAGPAFAQEPLSNSSLSGKYHFVQLLVSAASGETRTLGGAITFDGKGAFSLSGGGQGNYAVGAAGDVSLTSPIRPVEYLSAYLGADRDMLVGASTLSPGTTYDLFVAVRAPSGSVTNALLNGVYAGAWLELTPAARKSGLVVLSAAGNGHFSGATVTGHASDAGGRTVSQTVAGATYSLKPGGDGTTSFGTGAGLLAGESELFVSENGRYALGHLSGRGLLVAGRQGGGSAALEGRYWMAELQVDGPDWSAASGSLQALSGGRAVAAERVRLNGRLLDYAGLNAWLVNPDGTAALAPRLPARLTNMVLGAGGFAGAQMGPAEAATAQYGIFVGVRAPVFQGTGVFLDPAGVVNGASFAPWPHPVAPGAIVSLFGTGLATRQVSAGAYPLPTKLDDVEVTVNGAAAPLYFVSPTQVSIQVPYGLSGSQARFRVTNGRGASNEVTAALAATCPGVFFSGDYRGAVLHADYSLVSAANPARPGETVMLWLTGLGELSPAVPAGAAHPAAPLAWAVATPISVFFGGEPAPPVLFSGGAPGFAGLNQINVTIPLSAPVGASVPVAILTGNAYTDLVDIPIGR